MVQLTQSDPPWAPGWGDVFHLLVGYAVKAPSSHNSEPWRFHGTGGRLDVHADESRWLKVADADRRELHLSLGCALENLLLAAERFGYRWILDLFPDDRDAGHVATVRLEQGGGWSPYRGLALFEAIGTRRTNRGRFGAEPVGRATLEWLKALVVEPGLRLHVLEDGEMLGRLAELLAHADRAAFSDPAYRRELGDWVGRGVLGAPQPWARIASFVIRHFDLGRVVAARESALLEASPVVMVVSAETNDRATQVLAGMAVERLWLGAAARGLAVQPMSAMLEVPGVHERVAPALGTADRHVLHVFRLGHAKAGGSRTPRRSTAEVLEYA